MTSRCSTVAEAAEKFRIFADAEGDAVPMYARLCRAIAADPELAGLLLLAPAPQRLPVIVLSAFHDVALRDPSSPIAHWFPSITGDDAPTQDPSAALHATLAEYGELIAQTIATRRIQTNEVNRSVGWRLALGAACADDPRPLALFEVGASAGLNLRMDDYLIEVHTDTDAEGTAEVVDYWGESDSTVRLATLVRDAGEAGTLERLLDTPIPPITFRAGLDERPVDVTDPDDARWLQACVWPEQRVRFERLSAALERAAADPPPLRVGDMRQDLGALLDDTPDDHHAVVLSSWAMAYISREERSTVLDQLRAASPRLERRGARVSLLSLEPPGSLPWLPFSPIAEHEPASLRHSSLLGVTTIGTPGVHATALARCQAHVVWTDLLEA